MNVFWKRKHYQSNLKNTARGSSLIEKDKNGRWFNDNIRTVELAR
jgi:hypothetical protein